MHFKKENKPSGLVPYRITLYSLSAFGRSITLEVRSFNVPIWPLIFFVSILTCFALLVLSSETHYGNGGLNMAASVFGFIALFTLSYGCDQMTDN